MAFITEGGLAPLKQVLAELRDKGIPGKILTTSYLTFTEPKALKTLAALSNVEVRVYDSTDEGASGFHTKGYIFKEEEIYRFIIGSSNMTASAFSVNKEWNAKLVSTSDGELLKQMMVEFNALWTNEHRGLLVSSCGSGKTYASAFALRETRQKKSVIFGT